MEEGMKVAGKQAARGKEVAMWGEARKEGAILVEEIREGAIPVEERKAGD